MTYPEVLEYMYNQLPMFYRIGKIAYKPNLDTAIYLDNFFNNPHQQYKTIHVAGTNGKGSVSHMLAGILQKAGYRTGLFTSPHLKDFRERIRINGQMIPETEVILFIESCRKVFDEIKPSFFEMTSALAFYYFAKANVDIAVIEVGMGGRLDSTNIINPVLSIITNIGLDHTEYLGDTLDKIAVEKAGIIKDHVPVVIGEYNNQTWPVFYKIAGEHQSDISLSEKIFTAEYSLFTPDQKQVFNVYQSEKLVYLDLKLDLLGFYQRKNVCTVLNSVVELRKQGLSIEESAMYEALKDVSKMTGLQGRWQVIGNNPLIICDTGHNKDGISWVVQQIGTIPFRKLHMVIGMVKDKDVNSILKMLPVDAEYYFTNASIPRALPAEELKEMAREFHLKGNSYQTVAMALATAKQNAKEDDFIFVGGSTFVVAEIV